MSNKSKIVLKTLKELGTLWHSQSTLVFKSPTDKKVIGRWDNGEFIELDDVALELIEEWGFKVDQETFDKLYKEDEKTSDDEKSTEQKDASPPSTESKIDKDIEKEDLDVKENENATDENCSDDGSSDCAENEVNIPASKEVVTDLTENINVGEVLMKFCKENIEQGLKKIATDNQKTVDSLLNQLKITDNKLSKTEDLLTKKTKDFDELLEKYEQIKKKFDTMKSIFA